ncbi:Hypothetical protein A7982_05029 [Minicystis rosea]|nr:Hypothetical protein A7982_05029 [Minicystis rosea]
MIIRDGAALVSFRSIAPPVGAPELFDHIVSAVDVAGIPLLWLETAGGRGGFFRGDLVAVGEQDVRHMAASVMARAGGHALEVYAAVVRVLLAHEIGHAVAAKIGLVERGVGSELEADLTAGFIAESLGFPEHEDALVLDTAGSRAPAEVSTHPSSMARVAAYREGRRLRRARAGFRW